MLQILQTLLASNPFWRRFAQVRFSQRDNSTTISYALAERGIVLGFFEHEGLVKSFSVSVDDETVIDQMFFLTLEELDLFLSRVPEIRAADPLCSGSESIKALSGSLQKRN